MANLDENNPAQNAQVAQGASDASRQDLSRYGQIVLVLQGGGALGAYHAGVYQAMHEAGIEPDWVIGTSIGSVNGALIAGNKPADRLDRVRGFWHRISEDRIFETTASLPFIGRRLPVWAALMRGVSNFYMPNPFAFFWPGVRLPVDAVGLYSTGPLEATLKELVDFSRLTKGRKPRLTVGAANIKTSEMRYFDSRDMALNVRHILASGAMPPAFTPIAIDGTHFWDGGLVSNSPVEVVFDDNPRHSSLVFTVQVWHPEGKLPESIWDVLIREKELQFSSSASSQIARQKQIHHLRHLIAEISEKLPPEKRDDDLVRALRAFGCHTQMHIVRLLAPRDTSEDHMGEIDFSRASIGARWKAGRDDMRRVLAKAPWEGEFDPLEGLHWHEA